MPIVHHAANSFMFLQVLAFLRSPAKTDGLLSATKYRQIISLK